MALLIQGVALGWNSRTPSVFFGARAILAGRLGALYPALRASNLDPVTALAHE